MWNTLCGCRVSGVIFASLDHSCRPELVRVYCDRKSYIHTAIINALAAVTPRKINVCTKDPVSFYLQTTLWNMKSTHIYLMISIAYTLFYISCFSYMYKYKYIKNICVYIYYQSWTSAPKIAPLHRRCNLKTCGKSEIRGATQLSNNQFSVFYCDKCSSHICRGEQVHRWDGGPPWKPAQRLAAQVSTAAWTGARARVRLAAVTPLP